MGAFAGAGAVLGSLLSYFQNNKNANWGQSALINVLNSLQGAQSTGLGIARESYDPARQGSLSSLDRSNYLFDSPTGGAIQLQDQIGGSIAGLDPRMFQQSGLTGRSQALLDGTADNAAQGLAGANSAYGNILGGNGNVNQYQTRALDQLAGLAEGGGGVNQAQSAGINALQSGGYDPFGQYVQSMAPGVLGNLGATSGTSFGVNAAQQLLSQGGLNSQGQQGSNAALQGFLGGGQTPTTQSLQNIGTGYASQPALIPTALAASIAKDQAGNQARHAAESFQREALARGGGAGSTVANGAANAGLADFADQISSAQSQAYQNAITQQQGLNLQQQGQGAQMALGAANTDAGRLGTYGNLLGNLTGTANSGYNTGLSALGNLTNAQTNLAGTYGNLGIGAAQNANQRLNAGGGLINDASNAVTGASQGINGLSATQIQALLGAASGANSAYNNLGNLQLGSAQLGNSQANNYNAALNNYFNSQLGINQLGLNYQGQGLNTLLGLSGQGFNYASTGLAGQANLFGGYATQALQNQAGSTAALGGSIGNGISDALKNTIGGSGRN